MDVALCHVPTLCKTVIFCMVPLLLWDQLFCSEVLRDESGKVCWSLRRAQSRRQNANESRLIIRRLTQL